jgi:hypothetical protein
VALHRRGVRQLAQHAVRYFTINHLGHVRRARANDLKYYVLGLNFHVRYDLGYYVLD